MGGIGRRSPGAQKGRSSSIWPSSKPPDRPGAAPPGVAPPGAAPPGAADPAAGPLNEPSSRLSSGTTASAEISRETPLRPSFVSYSRVRNRPATRPGAPLRGGSAGEVVGGALRAVSPDADPEPVRGLDPLAGLLVLRGLVDGDAELGHGPPVRRVAQLRVTAEVADDLDLAEGHRSASSVDGGRGRFALGFVDPLPDLFLILVLDGRERGLVGGFGAVPPQADGALDADDEVAQHVLRDEDAALELGDRSEE